jgi:hypothetical protein
MMTRNEAEHRAAQLWGPDPDRTCDRAQDRWHIEPGRHTLDGNGHAVCHPACDVLEARVDCKHLYQVPIINDQGQQVCRLCQQVIQG